MELIFEQPKKKTPGRISKKTSIRKQSIKKQLQADSQRLATSNIQQ